MICIIHHGLTIFGGGVAEESLESDANWGEVCALTELVNVLLLMVLLLM